MHAGTFLLSFFFKVVAFVDFCLICDCIDLGHMLFITEEGYTKNKNGEHKPKEKNIL